MPASVILLIVALCDTRDPSRRPRSAVRRPRAASPGGAYEALPIKRRPATASLATSLTPQQCNFGDVGDEWVAEAPAWQWPDLLTNRGSHGRARPFVSGEPKRAAGARDTKKNFYSKIFNAYSL